LNHVLAHYCFSSGRNYDDEEESEMAGKTALMLAALKGHVGVTRLLIAANAKLEAEAW
jgi:ankyrin repeat protein